MYAKDAKIRKNFASFAVKFPKRLGSCQSTVGDGLRYQGLSMGVTSIMPEMIGHGVKV